MVHEHDVITKAFILMFYHSNRSIFCLCCRFFPFSCWRCFDILFTIAYICVRRVVIWFKHMGRNRSKEGTKHLKTESNLPWVPLLALVSAPAWEAAWRVRCKTPCRGKWALAGLELMPAQPGGKRECHHEEEQSLKPHTPHSLTEFSSTLWKCIRIEWQHSQAEGEGGIFDVESESESESTDRWRGRGDLRCWGATRGAAVGDAHHGPHPLCNRVIFYHFDFGWIFQYQIRFVQCPLTIVQNGNWCTNGRTQCKCHKCLSWFKL